MAYSVYFMERTTFSLLFYIRRDKLNKKASLLSHNVFRHRLAPNRGGRVVFTRDARSVQLHPADKQTTGGWLHPPVVISLEIGAF